MSFERFAHDITGLWHHTPYHDPDTTAHREGTPMATVLTEIHQAVTEGVANIKGWVEDLEQRLPKIAAMAEKYENSPIVQALETVTLGPELEQQVAGLINGLAKSFPASTTPAADSTPATPEQPAAPAA